MSNHKHYEMEEVFNSLDAIHQIAHDIQSRSICQQDKFLKKLCAKMLQEVHNLSGQIIDKKIYEQKIKHSHQ